MKKLYSINRNPKKEIQKPYLKPCSFDVNYTNTGWDKIDIIQKLPELIMGAGINEKITNYAELRGGYFNKVIMVETASTKNVVKISPLWNKGGLTRENFAYSNLKNKSGELFKLAKIYSFMPDSNTIIPGHAILIIEYIDGREPIGNELDSENFHEKIKTFLDSIHDIPTKEYGWFDQKLIGKNSSWHDFLINIDNLSITLNSKLLSKNNIDWVLNKLVSECTDNFEPVLLYGDLKQENILIKNGSLYIIDFENCFSGHQYYDIGIGLFFISQIWKYLHVYLKGVKQKEVKKQIILYAMRHAISCLGHRINIGDVKEIKVAIKKFFELKKIYENLSG